MRAAARAALLALPSYAGAGPVPGFSDLAIPGGRSTLRLAGVPDSTPRGTALSLAIRLLHADPPGSTAGQDERLSRVRTRLQQIGRLQAAVAEYGGEPVTLPAVGNDQAAGRASAALSAMGLRLQKTGEAYRAESDPEPEAVAVRDALADAGLDVGAVVASLNAGTGVRPAVPSAAIPLPLDSGTWSTIVLDPSQQGLPLAEAILLDRQAALSACGLLSMDASTRQWLVAHPSALKRITYRAGTLCAFGRSLSIDGGAVRLPGGAAAAAAWEALARAPASDPERFVPALFTRDEGRLAYFYDVVARLGPEMQAAVLAIPTGGGAPDLERLKDTYEPFIESTGLWRPYDRPFLRPLFDGALLVDQLEAGADGVPLGPRWLRFWKTAFRDTSLPDWPARLLRKMDEDGPVDVGAIIRETMIANVDERRARFEQIAFVQRAMPKPADAALPDVLVAIRGFARFPAIMLHLERLGTTGPALLAAAARRAAALDAIGDEPRRYQALAQLQGALSLLDGAAAARFLAAADLTRLVSSLLAVAPAGDEYRGGVARWLDRELLPALGAAGSTSPEAVVLRAWSGPREPATRPLVWEGQRYTVDPAGAERERLAKLRAIQGQSGLDAVVALTRVASTVAEAATIEAARSAAGDLAGAAAGLASITNTSLPGMDPIDEVVLRVVRELGRVKKAKDARAVAAALAPMWRHVDRSLAQALVSMAYTRHLGDPDTSVLTGDDMAARHDFGRAATPSPAWSRPRDSADETGLHLHGSLLGLDFALARLSVRRLSSDAIPPARSANENVVDEVRQGRGAVVPVPANGGRPRRGRRGARQGAPAD